MIDRGFTETDLRAMLEDAASVEEQGHGTFMVKTQHVDARWEVIVMPDRDKEIIIAITAYPGP